MKRGANRYLVGAAVLGGSTRPSSPPAAGWSYPIGWSDWDWRTIFYDPAGGMYRYFNQGPDPSYRPQGTAPNAYWAQQRKAQSPFAASLPQRQQAAQQLQQTLRAQQAANIAQLQQQLAMTSPAGVPKAFPLTAQFSMPSATSVYAPPSQPLSDTGSAPPVTDTSDGGAPSSDTSVVGADDDLSLIIKVKNLPEVVKKSSPLGGLIRQGAGYVPGASKLFDKLVYQQMADEFKKKMASEGVDADVKVGVAPPTDGSSSWDFGKGLAVGAGTVAGFWLLVKIIGSLAGGRHASSR